MKSVQTVLKMQSQAAPRTVLGNCYSDCTVICFPLVKTEQLYCLTASIRQPVTVLTQEARQVCRTYRLVTVRVENYLAIHPGKVRLLNAINCTELSYNDS